MQAWSSQVRKGLIELCALAVLAKGEAYGYEILQSLFEAHDLSITESTLYPILSRLASEGCLSVRKAPSPAGPPRRYYRLTALGKRKLGEMEIAWQRVRDAVDAILEERHGK